MSRRICISGCLAAVIVSFAHYADASEIALCTDLGTVVIELDEAAAPLHAANFLNYAQRGHYNGTVFHRVIPDFMAQAGGYDRQLRARIADTAVENESKNGLSNSRGTVAAARTAEPHSAAAQFFINLVDNSQLDGSPNSWGYTVFGTVTEGMEIIDAIAELPTHGSGPFPTDVPDPLVRIVSASARDKAILDNVDGPDLQAALLARIDAAREMNDTDATLEWISHYRSTCAPVGEDLLVEEARSAINVEEPLRAQYALEEYFASVSDTHRLYAQARELYSAIDPNQQSLGASPFSQCSAPSTPEVPDGTRDSLDIMIRGQTAVQDFMRASTAYLECLDELIDAGDTTSQQLTIDEYNRVVDLTQTLGDEFNQQVRAYRARQ